MRIPIEAGGEGGKRGVLRLRGGCASLAAAALRMTILLWAAALGMTILFWCSMASATSYYVSNGGTDAPSCTTAATACKTLAYVSSSITLNAGDSVLLQRGGIWNEQLVATASGTSGSPIVYDAYGTGPAPVITAAAPILPWTSGTGTPWIYVSGNTWKASMATTITPPTVNLVQFGALYGRKQPYGSGCASSIVSKYDWCLSWPWLYVWSGNSSANPVSTYATDVSIVPIVAQSAGLAMISIVGRNWLTFQHIKVQNFDYIGVSVTGGSDHLVFANMEVDGMVPYGTTPLGFYVNATNPTNIQFLNDDAHLNYDGFRFDGTATAITVTNCRGYANRDAGLSDNTGKATYSYSHFYGNNVAQFLASDVSGGIAGSGNIGLVCGTAAGFLSAPGMCSSTAGPVAVNFSPYPARFSFTVDDVGSQPNTEAYIDTFLGTGPFGSRGLHFNAAVVPSYPVIWSDVNTWYAAGNEIDSHSWSHQYYSTNTNPCGISPCSPPYPNAPSIDIQYTGSGTAATLTISGNPLSLSTTVTGAPADSIPSTNLSVPPYNTESGLLAYLAAQAHYTAVTDTTGPFVRPNTHTINLLNVSSQNIKTAPFALLYDQTKLEPEEMLSSKNWIQSNVAGLTESFYVYPDGIEDPTIEADAVAAGYTAARGSLAMKGQDNITASANSLYSNGVNVQNLTSLAAIQIHGLTQGQINQTAASLVFRAAAWGAPYGLFTHYNSRGDSTPDISNSELGYLLDAVRSNGGVWLTNSALASAVTSLPAIAISGTTRYIQNPTGGQVNLAVAGANSPTVGRGVVMAYPIDLQGTNRLALGTWDVGATAYLSQRYGTGSGTGTTTMGGWTGLVCGPPTYNCSRTDLITAQLPTTVPNVGTLTGLNTIVLDTLGNGNRIVRFSDVSWDPSSSNPSFISSGDGGGETNVFSQTFQTSHYLTCPENSGQSTYLADFNGATLTGARVYTSNFASTNGMRVPSNRQCNWSYTAGTYKAYFLGKGAAADTDKSHLSHYDLTDWATGPQTTPPSQVIDFDFTELTSGLPEYGNGNCLPSAYGSPTWMSDGGHSKDDLTFGAGFSISGGQGTGIMVAVYRAGFGCSTLNVSTGAVAGDWGTAGTATLPDGATTLHGVRISQDGNWLKYSPTGTGTHGPYFWQVGTLNVFDLSGNEGGHDASGYTHWVNQYNGSPAAMAIRSMSSMHSPTTIFTTGQLPSGASFPNDSLVTWLNANSTDTSLFIRSFWLPQNCAGVVSASGGTVTLTTGCPFNTSWTGTINIAQQTCTISSVSSTTSMAVTGCTLPSSGTYSFPPYAYAWIHEMVGAFPSGANQGVSPRFTQWLSTSQSAGIFDAYEGGPLISWDGQFLMFTSDWLGTLGSTSGASTCTTDNCRSDVFIIELR